MLVFGCGEFLDLPYRVVAIGQVLHEGDANSTHRHICLAARELQARRSTSLAFTVRSDSKNFSAQAGANSTSNSGVKIHTRIHWHTRSHQ